MSTKTPKTHMAVQEEAPRTNTRSRRSNFLYNSTNVFLATTSIAYFVSLAMIMFSWGLVVGQDVSVRAARAQEVPPLTSPQLR